MVVDNESKAKSAKLRGFRVGFVSFRGIGKIKVTQNLWQCNGLSRSPLFEKILDEFEIRVRVR